MGKKFNKMRSLEEGEVILDDVQETETFTEREQDTTIEQESANVEVTVSTSSEPTADLASSCQPTAAEIKFAKSFTGTPTPVDYTSIQLAQSCVAKKLLADFGTDGFARGSLWFTYCKR